MLEIQFASCYAQFFDESFETAIVYPTEKIPTVLDRTLEEIDLWTQPVVRCKHDPTTV